MGAWLDPAGILLACQVPSGFDAAPAPKYVQATEPEPATQLSKPVTCGTTIEPAHGGSEARLLVCGSGLALKSEATSIVICELVSVEVVPVPAVFGTDPVGVDLVPGVVNPQHTGCVLADTGQWVRRKKLSRRALRKR